MAVATDRQRHEDQEYSSSPAHCKCDDPGIFVFVSVLILAKYPGPGLGGVQAFIGGDGGQEPRGQCRGPPGGHRYQKRTN